MTGQGARVSGVPGGASDRQRRAGVRVAGVWPWSLGPYVDALLRVRGAGAAGEARAAFASLLEELDHGCAE